MREMGKDGRRAGNEVAKHPPSVQKHQTALRERSRPRTNRDARAAGMCGGEGGQRGAAGAPGTNKLLLPGPRDNPRRTARHAMRSAEEAPQKHDALPEREKGERPRDRGRSDREGSEPRDGRTGGHSPLPPRLETALFEMCGSVGSLAGRSLLNVQAPGVSGCLCVCRTVAVDN